MISRQVMRVLLLSLTAIVPALAETKVQQALDGESGLVIAPGFEIVKGQCSGCHSTALVTQHRLSREAWLSTIRWMQKSQGLWPLGKHEPVILDYLEKHYGPRGFGRRKPLPDHLLPRR